MFWHIPGYSAGGIVIGFLAGRYHLFTTHGKFPEFKFLHSISDDGVHWSRQTDVLSRGQNGAFDGFCLYDLQVIEHNKTAYMFYTGLDKPHGRGQLQATGLATSTDMATWNRWSTDAVLPADLKYYEAFVPDEATYQEKDRGRQWFRDPWVYPIPGTKQFGMAVGARAAGVHPDVNGCLAWAVSDDLLHWTSRPPLYCPRRFHTMECPVVFDLDGRTYLIWLSHPEWGAPLVTTDPWQRAGIFYAYSDQGIDGPFHTPADEMLIGGAYNHPPKGLRRMRAAVLRTVVGLAGQPMASYHLVTAPEIGDETTDATPPAWRTFATTHGVMPLLKPVRARSNGELEVTRSPATESLLEAPVALDARDHGANWRRDDGGWIGKHFSSRSLLWLEGSMGDGELSARIAVTRGLRAGLVLRGDADASTGLHVILDHNLGCIEWGTLTGNAPLDRRRWTPRGGWVDLRIIAHGPSIEIYCDGKLMLHQVRYREVQGRVGLLVDQAEACFTDITTRAIKAGTPLLIGE